MDTKKIISSIVLASVVVILLATVLIPVINDFTTENTTEYTNSSSSNRMSKMDLSGTHTIKHEANAETFTVDSTTITSVVWKVEIVSSLFNWRAGSTAGSGTINSSNGSSNNNAIDITITNGKLTGTVDGQTYTNQSLDWLYYYDESGDYCTVLLDQYSRDYYVNNYKQIDAANYVTTTSTWFVISNGVCSYGTSSPDLTVTSVTTYDNQVNKMKTGVVNSTPGSITFVVDNEGSNYTVNPSFLTMPYKIYGITEINEQALGLFKVLPILLIIALVVSMIGLVVVRGRN